MLLPVHAFDTDPRPVVDRTVALLVSELHDALHAIHPDRRNAEGVFRALLLKLGLRAPRVQEIGMHSGASYLFYLGGDRPFIVINLNSAYPFIEALFLLAHHILHLTNGAPATAIFSPFDMDGWQSSPLFRRHRVFVVSMLTDAVDATFHPIY